MPKLCSLTFAWTRSGGTSGCPHSLLRRVGVDVRVGVFFIFSLGSRLSLRLGLTACGTPVSLTRAERSRAGLSFRLPLYGVRPRKVLWYSAPCVAHGSLARVCVLRAAVAHAGISPSHCDLRVATRITHGVALFERSCVCACVVVGLARRRACPMFQVGGRREGGEGGFGSSFICFGERCNRHTRTDRMHKT